MLGCTSGRERAKLSSWSRGAAPWQIPSFPIQEFPIQEFPWHLKPPRHSVFGCAICSVLWGFFKFSWWYNNAIHWDAPTASPVERHSTVKRKREKNQKKKSGMDGVFEHKDFGQCPYREISFVTWNPRYLNIYTKYLFFILTFVFYWN